MLGLVVMHGFGNGGFVGIQALGFWASGLDSSWRLVRGLGHIRLPEGSKVYGLVNSTLFRPQR